MKQDCKQLLALFQIVLYVDCLLSVELNGNHLGLL